MTVLNTPKKADTKKHTTTCTVSRREMDGASVSHAYSGYSTSR